MKKITEHENITFIIEDIIQINLGTPKEPWEVRIEKSQKI